MMLIEETKVPQNALPVALFKEHMRLGSGFSDDGLQDALLEGFLRSAMVAIEGRIGKALIERGFTYTVARWARETEQSLPIAPVSAISSVVIVDRLGAETLIAPEDYTVVPDGQRPLVRAVAGCLPSLPPSGSARISFLAGFGPDWSDLPSDLQQAVLLLAAHYYEYRHEVQFDGRCMPFGVTALIERHRPVRLGGGVSA